MADNPPAFPQQCADALDVGMVHTGMSLLDYFAGQALANPTICTGSAPEYQLSAWFDNRTGIRREEIIARQAMIYANAMLAERGRELAKARAGEGSV